jgi:hypothetical protein
VQPARDAQTVDEPTADPSRAAGPVADSAADRAADSAAVPAPRAAPEAARPVPAQPGTGDPARRDAPEAAGPDDAPGGARPGEPEAALTEREREILAFEQKWWKHAGAKEQAIRDAFDLSATRYYQLLNGLLDNPAALAVAPVLVGRLRRLRATRTRTRRR